MSLYFFNDFQQIQQFHTDKINNSKRCRPLDERKPSQWSTSARINLFNILKKSRRKKQITVKIKSNNYRNQSRRIQWVCMYVCVCAIRIGEDEFNATIFDTYCTEFPLVFIYYNFRLTTWYIIRRPASTNMPYK